jgi:branched-chain amino acid transport system permease protein
MATLSAYIAWLVATWSLLGWGLPVWVGTIAAMLFGFALGGVTEYFVVRPLERRSPLAVFVALIAVFLGLNALTRGIWSDPPEESIGNIFPNEPDDFVRIAGAVWRYRDIGTLAVTLLVAFLLYLLFQKTKVGLAMRAVASNGESSRLVGIPRSRILIGSWGLAGSLAALAATLHAGAIGTLSSFLMFNVFVYASAAATLGGLDSPLGAVVAGLGLGVVESFAVEYAPGWVGQEMKLGLALVIIFVVLLVRPSGLFGTAKVERV